MSKIIVAAILALIVDTTIMAVPEAPSWFCFMFGLTNFVAAYQILNLFYSDEF